MSTVFCNRKILLLAAAAVAAVIELALVVAPVQAQVTTQVIAISGDQVPDGNGTFYEFAVPAPNDAGQVAFFGRVSDPSNGIIYDGIFRGSGGPLTQIARPGQAAPDGNGTIGNVLRYLVSNDSGHAAFLVDFTGTTGTTPASFEAMAGR